MTKSTTGTPPHEEGFNSKLLGYSATPGAALLLAPASHAQAIQNITEFSINGGATFSSTPPTLGFGSFSFTAATGARNKAFAGSVVGRHTTNYFGFRLGATRVLGNGVGQVNQTFDFNFANHAVVAGGAPYFGPSRGIIALRASGFSSTRLVQRSSGNFVPAGANAHKSGYIGFKTAHSGYGWLKIQVTNDASGNPGTISFVRASDGLFGQIGDSSTITDGVSAIPEPASVASGLGLLALGAAGVREMRRRRKAAA